MSTTPHHYYSEVDPDFDFESLSEQTDDIHVDDFDFAAVISGLSLADTSGSLDEINSHRDAYQGAARRAGRRNPAAAWYNAVNTPLFRLRKTLQFRISSLTLSGYDIDQLTRAADAADIAARAVAAGGQVASWPELRNLVTEAVDLVVSSGDPATRWRAAAAWLSDACRGQVGDPQVLRELSDDLGERVAFAEDSADDVDWALRRARSELDYVTEILVIFNHGLATAYARKFTSNTSRDDSADVQAAANLGLMRAVSTYDPDRGLFGSWAFKPIQRDTLKAVRDVDFTNMTHGDFERRPVILRAYERLVEAGDGTQPSFDEVAAEAGVTVDLVSRVLAAPHVDSIHTPVGDEGDTEFGDLIADRAPTVEEAVISNLEVDALRTYGLPVLDPKERYIIVRRFGLHGEPPEALSDIGRDLGLSRESVRQNANKALARLLHPSIMSVIVRGGRV